MTESNFEDRIEAIEKYSAIGNRLDNIIDDKKDRELLLKAIDELSIIRGSYEAKMRSKAELKGLERDLERIKGKYIDKVLSIYDGDRATAGKAFDKDLRKPNEEKIKEALLHSHAYAVIALIMTPISLKFSKRLWNMRDDWIKIREGYQRAIEINREAAVLAGEEEYLEAKVHTELTELGLKDKTAHLIIETPEIVDMLIIESLKTKHAPWM